MNIKQGLFRPFIKKIVSTYFSDVIIQLYVYLTKLPWNWGKFFSSVQVLNNIWHKCPELAQYLAICQYRPCLLTKCKWRVTLSTLIFHTSLVQLLAVTRYYALKICYYETCRFLSICVVYVVGVKILIGHFVLKYDDFNCIIIDNWYTTYINN